MRLNSDPRLPGSIDSSLRSAITRLWREVCLEVNRGVFWDEESATVPTGSAWAVGQKIKNSNPSELGTTGSKYILIGWCYTAGGWKEMRCLTGN